MVNICEAIYAGESLMNKWFFSPTIFWNVTLQGEPFKVTGMSV